MQTVEITFKAVIAGNPISGPVLAVPTDATDTSFSGYALIYDPGHATQKLKIVEWNAATLETLGTVLSAVDVTLVADDVIRLTYNTTGALQAYVNDIENASLAVTDFTLINPANQGMGIVVVGNTGADDRMRWDGLAGNCSNSGGSGGGGDCCDCTIDPDNPGDIQTVICASESTDVNLWCTVSTQIIQACGGTAPYVWSVDSGTAILTEVTNSCYIVEAHTVTLEAAAIQRGVTGYEQVLGPPDGCVGVAALQAIQTESRLYGCNGLVSGGLLCNSTPSCFPDCGGPYVATGTRTDIDEGGAPGSTTTIFGFRLCKQSGSGHATFTAVDTGCGSPDSYDFDISTLPLGEAPTIWGAIYNFPEADCGDCSTPVVIRITDALGAFTLVSL